MADNKIDNLELIVKLISFVFTIVVHLAIIVTFVILERVKFFENRGILQEEKKLGKPIEFIPARLLKLGRTPEKTNRFPQRIVPALATAPPEGIPVSKQPTPPKKIESKEERVSYAVEDEKFRRALARAKAYAEIQEKPPEEGDPSGVEWGTLTDPAKVSAGNFYATYLYRIFKERWIIPVLIDENTQRKLKCQAFIKINRELRIEDYKIVRSSGNLLFDNSVIDAIKRVDAEIKHLSPPPQIIADYIFNYGIIIDFYGSDATRE